MSLLALPSANFARPPNGKVRASTVCGVFHVPKCVSRQRRTLAMASRKSLAPFLALPSCMPLDGPFLPPADDRSPSPKPLTAGAADWYDDWLSMLMPPMPGAVE